MGAGLIPTSFHDGKLYFLFGRENKYDDSYPNHWADFGGGTDDNETYLETAIREGTEEITGFLGSFSDMKKKLKKGVYVIENKSNGFKPFRTHLFSLNYDEKLPYYYNNNQLFLQKKLDQKIIKNSKIFEKAEIKWFSIDDLIKNKKEFKKWYQVIIEKIINEKMEIMKFIKNKSKPKTKRNKSGKNMKKSKKNKSKKIIIKK